MKTFLNLIFAGILISVNAQSVELNDIRLNGNIPFQININELKSLAKQIDSIKLIPELMDMSIADSIIYIGKTHFEFYKVSQKCELSVVYFDEKITELNIGKLTLSNKTTEKDISEYFKSDCSSTNFIDIYGETEKYITCGIPLTLNGKMTDNRLLFFFLNGKLKRIDLWEPS
ncbi:hypothetical protein G3567_10850 [Psychroflexus sp. YR1-1]|uniref:Uncharacterized protein n=1 Tax=Psychroflexus aurantiacus TaxID=2709310 RepID=A0A6B3R2R9_9FLAO|nr:hypothetical protein [Psychroflexus aurantiacus]NEV94642.1 hypothetical protein [Psychroflexus aurantiacus]